MSPDRRGPNVAVIEALAYYTLELARPADGWGRLSELTAQARQASREMQEEGVPVRFLRSIYLPEEETCFYLYEAPSIEVVCLAAGRANLAFDRVAEAIGSAADGRKETSCTDS